MARTLACTARVGGPVQHLALRAVHRTRHCPLRAPGAPSDVQAPRLSVVSRLERLPGPRRARAAGRRPSSRRRPGARAPRATTCGRPALRPPAAAGSRPATASPCPSRCAGRTRSRRSLRRAGLAGDRLVVGQQVLRERLHARVVVGDALGDRRYSAWRCRLTPKQRVGRRLDAELGQVDRQAARRSRRRSPALSSARRQARRARRSSRRWARRDEERARCASCRRGGRSRRPRACRSLAVLL